MKADSINLLEFISTSKRTFIIPVYQRNYDWKKIQCLTLFRDIEKIAIDIKRSIHFLGTMVYIQGEDTATFREFIVIDGQQRLTSIMLLLKAISERTTDEDIREDIYELYLINKRAPEQFRIKLKPMKSDFATYKELINGEDETLNESAITSNYKYFLELIDSSDLTPEQIYKGIQKIEVVYIQLSKENENPQLIFESLNSTGLDLTEADLIRNYLLMGQEYSKQEELYNNYWVKIERILPDQMISDFIRDYLTLKTAIIPNKDKVYKNFKEYYENLNNFDAEGILDELKTYGKYYSWFKYCSCPDIEVNKRLIQLDKLKSTVVYPFLLSVFEDCYLYRKITNKEVCNVLDTIISYVLRRMICELPTNALNKVFAILAKDVIKEKHDELELSKKIGIILLNKKGKVTFPNNNLLKESFINKDFYHFKQVRYVLEEIIKSESKENVQLEELTIEHIMPQNLNPRWQVDLGKRYKEIHETNLHKIGNLTLTAYNPELSNKAYGEKKEFYLTSNIMLNRKLAEIEEWNEKEINDRANMLFERVIQIWKFPEIEEAYINPINVTNEFEIMDDVDVTGKSPYEIQICGSSYRVDSWRNFFGKICKVMYEYDSQIFRSLLRHNDFKGRKKRIITIDKDSLNKAEAVAEGIYIEQTLNANDALNYSKLVVDKYEDMENEITYKIR
ncbi:DUF262 domain-containing protein [Anaerovorax odorimutans]|uniref:DUF262 domain-containing protein n=1 Tax=Anaerovorax odorimutans TaxID=109327 RepID=UPI00041E9B0F|nr:DUF262 domain-containing protein [Anaerovorax odorimutans]